jgi:hypothetical protein
MFTVTDIDVVERHRGHAAQLVGNVVRYQHACRLC